MSLFVEIGEGVDKIHALQFHDNEDIYKKAYHLIDVYFNSEEDDGLDSNAQEFTNAAPEGGYTF